MNLERAKVLDAADELRRFRDAFVIPDDGLVYLDGNSLGRLPRAAVELAADLVQRQWGERLIRGWNDGWLALPTRLGAKIARLIGAEPDEVVVCDSTSVNLFKLASAALAAQRPRAEILTDQSNFPSDIYVLGGCGQLRVCADGAEAASLSGPDTALVALTATDFRSGATLDLPAMTRQIQAAGAWALWDLSHSVGAMPIDLGASGAALAVGCTYKYLNGGPGAPAFLYVRRDLQERLRSPIQGWFGQSRPFDFGLEYTPGPGVMRFLAGTPPVISTALMEPGLDLLLAAGMPAVRRKSLALTEFLMECAVSELAEFGVTVASPVEETRRGSHVSLRHPEAWRLTRALVEEQNVIPDFRAPDLIRFGVAPLYNSFEEVWKAISGLKTVLLSDRSTGVERSLNSRPEDWSGVT